MGLLAGGRCIEFQPLMSPEKYHALYRPMSDKPVHTIRGNRDFQKSLRNGLSILKQYLDNDAVEEVHLLDYVYTVSKGSCKHCLKGVRVYGDGGRFLMDFPNLTLFGNAYDVLATYELLKVFGARQGDCVELTESIQRRASRRQGSSTEEFDYIRVALVRPNS